MLPFLGFRYRCVCSHVKVTHRVRVAASSQGRRLGLLKRELFDQGRGLQYSQDLVLLGWILN